MDARRRIPATDRVLDDPVLAGAVERLGRDVVRAVVHDAQRRARHGQLDPERVIAAAREALPASAGGMRRVVNACGVLLHTNLGRAPLSDAAVEAVRAAAGTTDVELDLTTGRRGPRGRGVRAALTEAVPAAEAAHVVNNGAAALSLVATALAAGREIVLARGELVEIGDGFRIPDLLTSTGARLREVGTTNRVRFEDYRDAIGPDTGFVLKVHPSNFRITGFTSQVPVAALRELPVPVIADIGSGLLRAHPALPDEPDAQRTLAAGADLVTASGDKLLGGPQAGLLLGSAELVRRLERHPLARALRVDKLTLAALEATVRGPATPTAQALDRGEADLLDRARRLAASLRERGIDADARTSTATVGGGGAPGVELPSAAVTLPSRYAAALRTGRTPVLARVEHGQCLLDLCAVAPADDAVLLDAVTAVG
ncbi:L-seryl-tRNA(Sec) selenium transferase [Saccharopolyspora gloriosae]|uniref:L-seryl-tRNA(Sec) selenium transferase n=1 Tax=Saccharopolyspora gloriosae TaxID=455344 RepID=A0A840NK59_9PSEU|nr:L-seryl-tRNA(Sec) selenium transferase [Saccharopolyspora gloriosae]MBB5069532.1 L-seryl-tRNA(Ser) seleniumtransferase [Saccharopolyspora gloriosae]